MLQFVFDFGIAFRATLLDSMLMGPFPMTDEEIA